MRAPFSWTIRFSAALAALVSFAFSLSGADRTVDPITSRIRRATIESSALTALGYSKNLRALEVEFRDGLIYRYLDVPPAVYRELLSADSRARFYNQQIRGRYRCLRVRPRRTR